MAYTDETHTGNKENSKLIKVNLNLFEHFLSKILLLKYLNI